MRKRLVVIGGAVIGLALTACSSSATSSSSTPASESSTPASSSSTPASPSTAASVAAGGGQATGSTISWGIINTENSPAGSEPELRQGAQIAIDYINASLGGWKGHRLALNFCQTDGGESTAATCGVQLATAKVPLVLDGVDGGSDSALVPLAKAAIPMIGMVPLTVAAYTSPDSFALAGGGVANTPEIATYIATVLKAKKVAVLVVDNPSALQAVNEGAGSVFKALGVSMQVIPVEETTADYSTAWAQAAAGHPDFILTVFGTNACVALMEGRMAAGVTIPSAYTDTCTNASVLKSAGSAADGGYSTSTTLLPSSSDPDVKTYLAQIQKYGGTANEGGYQQIGFALVMNTYKVAESIPGTAFTPAAMTAGLKAAVNVPGFMSHSFSCNGTVMKALPSVCNMSIRIVRIENGALTDVGGGWLPK